MTFVIADLHLGDARALSPRRAQLPGIIDIDAEIMRRWNSVVRETDRVFVLGDVGAPSLLRRLHGEKHLIAGNADDLTKIARAGVFVGISVAKWLSGFLLTHIPVHPGQLRGRTINVHGHLHSRSIPDPRYRCVSVEQTNFAPVRLDSLAATPEQARLL